MGKQELKLVNLMHLCSYSGMTSVQADRVLSGLYEEMLQACTAMELAREQQDWKQVRRIAHHQMPVFRMLDIAPMIGICEGLLQSDEGQPDAGHLNAATAEFLQVAHLLKAELQEGSC